MGHYHFWYNLSVVFSGVANLLIRGEGRFALIEAVSAVVRVALNITSVFILYLCRLRRVRRRQALSSWAVRVYV